MIGKGEYKVCHHSGDIYYRTTFDKVARLSVYNIVSNLDGPVEVGHIAETMQQLFSIFSGEEAPPVLDEVRESFAVMEREGYVRRVGDGTGRYVAEEDCYYGYWESDDED